MMMMMMMMMMMITTTVYTMFTRGNDDCLAASLCSWL
jgi:hypothetical protein